MQLLALGVCVASAIFLLASAVWLAVIASKESSKHALLVMLIPPYAIYYGLTRWKKCKWAAICYIAGTFVTLGCRFMLYQAGVDAVRRIAEDMRDSQP